MHGMDSSETWYYMDQCHMFVDSTAKLLGQATTFQSLRYPSCYPLGFCSRKHPQKDLE